MKELTITEMKSIQGGFKIGLLAAIGSAITFLIGLVDGYIRPVKCNN